MTDEFLQVKDAAGIFAVGDCATIELKKLLHDLTFLFEKADKNNDGSLSMTEFHGERVN